MISLGLGVCIAVENGNSAQGDDAAASAATLVGTGECRLESGKGMMYGTKSEKRRIKSTIKPNSSSSISKPLLDL